MRPQEYIRQCRRLYELLTCHKRISNVQDSLFIELKGIVLWFDQWRSELVAQHTVTTGTKCVIDSKWKTNFISDKTYQDLHWAVDGMIAMLAAYLARYGAPGGTPQTCVGMFSHVQHDMHVDDLTATASQHPANGASAPSVYSATLPSTPARLVRPRQGAFNTPVVPGPPRTTPTNTRSKASSPLTVKTVSTNQNVVEGFFAFTRRRTGGPVTALHAASSVSGARASGHYEPRARSQTARKRKPFKTPAGPANLN